MSPLEDSFGRALLAIIGQSACPPGVRKAVTEGDSAPDLVACRYLETSPPLLSNVIYTSAPSARPLLSTPSVSSEFGGEQPTDGIIEFPYNARSRAYSGDGRRPTVRGYDGSMNMPLVVDTPEDPEFLKQFARASMLHAHLDNTLKMFVRSFDETSIEEALEYIGYQGAARLRKRVVAR